MTIFHDYNAFFYWAYAQILFSDGSIREEIVLPRTPLAPLTEDERLQIVEQCCKSVSASLPSADPLLPRRPEQDLRHPSPTLHEPVDTNADLALA